MMKTWLHLSAEGLTSPSKQWPCCVWRAAGDNRQMTLDEAAVYLAGQPVHLLLPMEMCSGLRTDVWPSKRRPSAQAIAFAIEEQVGEDLEALHVCVGPRDGAGCYPVLVTHKARFKALLHLLATLAIEVRAVHVDADMLPGDCAVAVHWYGRRVVRCPAPLAMSAVALKTLEGVLSEPLQWLDEEASRAQVEQVLWGAQGQPINLLHGELGRVRQRWPWSTLVRATAVLFLLEVGFMQLRSQYVEGQAHRLYAQSVERFQAMYPEQTRIVDLAAQLKALQGQNANQLATPLTRLVSLSEQVIGGADVEVQRMEFRRGEGWTIQLAANGFTALERLREQGQRSGMPVRIGHASKEGHRVHAVLMLEDPS